MLRSVRAPGAHRRGHLDLRWLRREVFTRVDEPVLLEVVLLVVELAVPATMSEQFGMRAALNDLAVFEDENLIGAANRGQTMCDHERGPAMTQRAQAVLNHRFAFA